MGGGPHTMRIVISTNTLVAGGAERQRVALANGLSARGYDVELVLIQAAGPLLASVSDAVSITRGWSPGRRWRRPDALITGTTNTECLFALRASRSAARPRGWLMAVHNPTGPGAPPPSHFVRFCSRRLADQVIGLSSSHAAWARTNWNMPVHGFIGNGTDLRRYRKVADSRRTATEFEFDFGFLGRLSTGHKGLDTLIEALSSTPGRLAIAGEGPDRRELMALAEASGVTDRITWLGYQEPEELFLRARVLVLPSRFEGQPMVLLEAAASGVPVVATRVGAAEELVASDQLVPPGDPAQLAEALRRSSQAVCGSVRRDIDDMVAEYEAVLEGLRQAHA